MTSFFCERVWISDRDFQIEKVNSLQSSDSISVIGRGYSDVLAVTLEQVCISEVDNILCSSCTLRCYTVGSTDCRLTRMTVRRDQDRMVSSCCARDTADIPGTR